MCNWTHLASLRAPFIPEAILNSMSKHFYVYIMTNWRNSVLYTGVTSNLQARVFEHKEGLVPGFTSRYYIKKLVYFEECADALSAIAREKQIKG
jgi:putative endonuclease